MQADEFPLTHEFLGNILDVRPTTMSLTASALQHAGLIRYSRGQVTVLDAPGSRPWPASATGPLSGPMTVY